ncbi:hypothetical protein NDU88_010028 [Pleurodeles waltl]|uniref:Uncharacterized protein n=1 Tax=Pleurodeles waltl TaxID=8319 RepID=A0AAV7QUH9_PLEWA|nr:hypothetical protein NDU88_010028 [Pleurodeles waltl]
MAAYRVSSGPRRCRGGDGGAETAGSTTLPGADPFCRRRDPDLRQGSPQTRACRPVTRNSPPEEKACPGGGVALL